MGLAPFRDTQTGARRARNETGKQEERGRTDRKVIPRENRREMGENRTPAPPFMLVRAIS